MSMGAILLFFRSLIRALSRCSKVLSLENIQINLIFCSLIRTFDVLSKVLTLGKIKFLLFFRSLIRTFARVLWKKYNKNIWIRTQLLALC